MDSALMFINSDMDVIVQFIINAHSSIIMIYDEPLESNSRKNYATSKFFLELISTFKAMLDKSA